MFSFLDRFRASSGDRSPWGDFWFEPVTMRTSSGMRVSPDNAMRLDELLHDSTADRLRHGPGNLPICQVDNFRNGGTNTRSSTHLLRERV